MTNESDESKKTILVGRAAEIKRELEVRKALYQELDQILLELARLNFSSLEFDGLIYTLIDHFKLGNTGWTSAAVRRFDLKVEPKEKLEKRLEREERKKKDG